MRRLLTLAATTVLAGVAVGAAQAQAPARVLSWPGKTAPAPATALDATAPMPSPFVANAGRPPAMTARVENRYSPRSSAPRQIARAEVPTPFYAPVPAPIYAPLPVYAPQPAPVMAPAPYVAPVMRPSARPTPSSIFDPAVPDRAFDPAPASAAAPVPAPVPVMATATPLAPPMAPSSAPATPARAASPNGPRFYSVHREFGAVPDRAPHPAVMQGATADPLPTGFFNANAAPEDDDTVEERPIERKAPAKPKRRSAKR